MCKIKYNQRRQTFEITLEVWKKNKKIPICTDNEKIAADSTQIITEKIARINRNKEKISRMLFDYYADYMSYIFDNDYHYAKLHEPFNDTFEDFADNLYISEIFADIYKNGDIVICFTVKSRKKYPLAASAEFELHMDNSINM